MTLAVRAATLVVLATEACAGGSAGADGRSPLPSPSMTSPAAPDSPARTDPVSGAESRAVTGRADAGVEQPLPLRGGTRGAPPADAGPSKPEPCARNVVLDKLRAVTSSCRAPTARVCGTVTLRPSADGGSVHTTFDLSGTVGVAAFSTCVAQKLGALPWHCPMDGDVTFDLGCDL